MKPCQRQCLLDTNVLIDFHTAQALDVLLQLPFRWALPSLLTWELLDPSAESLRARGVEVCELSGEEVSETLRLRVRYSALSLVDCALLVLAQRKSALVLSGDQKLVEVARDALGLEVHGTLWALDELLQQGIVDRDKAAEILRKMINAGRRLPLGECEKCLKKWESCP